MRLPPPVIALLAAGTQRVLTPNASPPSRLRRTAAATTAAAAVGLMGSAIREFRASGTTVDPIHPERASALVTTGPFGLTRNPMYVGLAGLLAAHAILRGSSRALPPAAAFVALMDRVQIPPEEAAMRTLFATEYDAYLARSPRWLGV